MIFNSRNRRQTPTVHAARAVVALASQSYGTSPAVDQFGPRCPVLLIDGTDDEILPPSCSERIHRLAHEPKRLVLCPGGRHVLDECADQVRQEILGIVIPTLESTAPDPPR